jgi:predicted dehydrogenase
MKLQLALAGALASGALARGGELRVGIIGCDTSHCVAFTEIMNDPKTKGHVEGAKVVAFFKSGSPDIESSWSRVEQYSSTLQTKYGVKAYDSIEAMCRDVDCILLESVDGRPHLEQVKPVMAAKKRVYIDKPMAGSLRDALQIFDLARKARVPLFSASSLRFAQSTQSARHGAIGRVMHAETTSPCSLEPHHPDLFWYGIHGVESLFTVMGTGIQRVNRGTTTNGTIEVVGVWRGGRTGIYREGKTYGGTARGTQGEMPVGNSDGYAPLVAEIVKFFQTGVVPVKPEETIEILAFMEAADESKRRGGAEVKVRDVLKQARRPGPPSTPASAPPATR